MFDSRPKQMTLSIAYPERDAIVDLIERNRVAEASGRLEGRSLDLGDELLLELTRDAVVPLLQGLVDLGKASVQLLGAMQGALVMLVQSVQAANAPTIDPSRLRG